MAGPMGGGRGGGSFGGGGFGGGPRGGGFGGGFHRGPHRPHFYGGFGPRFYGYGYGGGCLGGLLGALMAPFIMLLVVGVLLFAMIGSTVANVANGGVVSYNETTFQEYAKKEYAKAFGSSDAIEDNVLIVVLVNETSDGYYYIPWGGYNLKDEVVELFDVGADFDQAMQGTIQDYYANSLDGDLARVMRTMSRKIQNLGLDSSFYDEYSHENTPESALVNYTTLGMSEKTVNDALADFTEETGIPVVIVVETMENVFGKSMPMEDIFILVVLLGMAGIAIYLIVRAVKNRKNYDNNNQNGSDSNNGGNSGGFGNARGFDNDSRGW